VDDPDTDEEDNEFLKALDATPSGDDLEEPPTAPVDATGQTTEAPATAVPPPISQPKEGTEVPPPSAEGQPQEAQPSGNIDIDLFAPEAAPQVAPPPAPATAVPETQVQAPGTVDRQVEYTRLREQAISEFEKAYAFTPEDTKMLMVEPEKLLPRLFARLHADIAQSVMAGLTQQLPVMMQSSRSVSNEQQKFSRQFFSTWPQLAQAVQGGNNAVVNDIKRGLQLQRQLDPTMKPEELIRSVGAAVMVKHQMPIQMAPAAPPVSNVPPVRPMNPGGGSTIPAPRGPTNWVDDMVKTLAEEEVDSD